MKIKTYRKTLLVFCTLTLLAGCRENDYPEDCYNYVIIPSSPDVNSQQICGAFQETVERYGANAVIKTPEDTSAQSQVKILKEIKDKNIDCLAISANGSSVFQEELEEMMARGVKVVGFDQVLQRSEDDISIQVCASRLDKTGEMVLSIVQKNVEDKVKQMAILMPNNFHYNEVHYGKDIRSLLEAGKYPDILLTEVNYTNDDSEKCKAKVEHLTQTYPDLDVIFTTSTVSTVAASEYLKENGLSDRVKVVGMALPEKVLDLVGEDNVCVGVIYCEPTKLGRLTAWAALAVTEEGFTAKEGEVLKTAEIGNYRVETMELDYGSSLPTVFMQDSPNFMQ